jgi:hypothetical protein
VGITDFIGGRGEAIAYMWLSQLRRGDDVPYFWPHYLGEKCETFDFLVELVDAGEQTPFFFVQVKATRRGYTRHTPPRLSVKVADKDVRRMSTFPAPTYVVGVHENEERAFLISVHGAMRDAMSSISTEHELTGETLSHLFEEVRASWQGRDMTRPASRFIN